MPKPAPAPSILKVTFSRRGEVVPWGPGFSLWGEGRWTMS